MEQPYLNNGGRLFGSSELTPQKAEEAQEDLESVGLIHCLHKQAASLTTNKMENQTMWPVQSDQTPTRKIIPQERELQADKCDHQLTCLLFYPTPLFRDAIAMGYEPDGRDSIPERGKRLFSTPQRPDQLWAPPSLLLNGHWRLINRG